MKIKNKWLPAAAALIILTATLLTTDVFALRQLSLSDLVPVLLIAVVIFVVKTGVLSAILIGLKKLLERFKRI